MSDSSGDGPRSPLFGAQLLSLQFRRRDLLKWVGISSAFRLTGIGGMEGCSCAPSAKSPGVSGPMPDFATTLRRRDDLLHLHLELFNLAPNADDTKLLRKADGPAYLVVTHAAQHVYEEAFSETAPLVLKTPVRARLAGDSRLAFLAPADLHELDFTPKALLDACASWELSVSDNALPPHAQQVLARPASAYAPSLIQKASLVPSLGTAVQATPAIANAFVAAVASSQSAQADQAIARSSGLSVAEAAVPSALSAHVAAITATTPKEPTKTQTALELPFRLTVSPNHYARFAHASDAVTSPKGRVELWHTRLGVQSGAAVADESAKTASLRTIRALWTRDPKFDPKNPCTYTDPTDPTLFNSSLNSQDRIAIVHESSNFAPVECGTKKASALAPAAISVNRLMLTSLGGYLDSKGDWGSNPLYSVKSWTHRMGLGRDHYVELHYSGILYPFGHQADLVKITERKFTSLAPHTAYLWQRQFIVVREPVKAYPLELRHLPFTEVELKTLVTPDLGPAPATFTKSFVPNVDSVPFRFHMQGLDRGGRLVRFEVGAVWVPVAAGKTASSDVDDARALYVDPIATADLQGQRVAFASCAQPDDTTFETHSMSFAEPVGGPTPDAAVGFLPGLAQAELQVEALRHLAGQQAASAFQYAKSFLDNEFGAGNEGELLMQLASGTVPVDFLKDSSKSGGFVAPSLDISGLSRRVGPVAGDLTMIASNTFDPSTFLASLNAKLFGVFDLKDVIMAVAGGDGGLGAAPKFITQALSVVEEFMQDLAAVQAQAQAVAKELMALGEAVDASLTDIATKAETLVKDVAAIRLDEAHIDGDIDLVVNTDLPAFTKSLNDAAALFGKEPLPAALQKVMAGPRAALKQRLDQLVSVVGTVASTLHDALKAFRMGEELAKNLTVRLDWRPPIQGFPSGAGNEIFAPKKSDAFLLAIEARGKDSPGKPAGVDLLAALENFEIRLIAPATFMTLKFKRIAFSVRSGKKPDIDVVFDEMSFDGVLSFVDTLRKLIPLAGFSDPPSLDVSTQGIKAQFTLGLPNIAVGMFSLTNLSFTAGFHIPFVGNPLSVSFQFCKRESPFHLTVAFLGGGGFFGIEVSPKGVLLLEAELEFGAGLAVDFGVASGSVSIMAGIYFRMELSDATLTGYLRMRGAVNVLGLITASIELYMELSYEFSSQKLVGRATIEIEITIVFFSISVSVSAERKFAGSNADPTFEDVMAPTLGYDPFADYVAAFDFAA